MAKVYAAYRGDEYIGEGTMSEVAGMLGVSKETARYYAYQGKDKKLKTKIIPVGEKLETAECERCGKEFQRRDGRRKYCDSCYEIVKKERNRKRHKNSEKKNGTTVYKKVWPVCGNKFEEIERGKWIYCSPECREKAIKEQAKKNNAKAAEKRKREKKEPEEKKPEKIILTKDCRRCRTCDYRDGIYCWFAASKPYVSRNEPVSEHCSKYKPRGKRTRSERNGRGGERWKRGIFWKDFKEPPRRRKDWRGSWRIFTTHIRARSLTVCQRRRGL